MNRAYAELFQYEREEDLIGTPITDLLATQSFSEVMNNLNNCFQGTDGTASYDTKGRRKDGKTFDMEIRTSCYSHDNVNHTVIFIRNISDIKSVEMDLEKKNSMLKMIAQCHQILSRTKNEKDFLDSVCRMIEKTGGYDKVEILISENIVSENSDVSGRYNISMKLPLTIEKERIGTMALYTAGEHDFSREKENLENLSDEISYCLNSIRLEKNQINLESQLLQAQKMETLGTLAGGIAHDFNNIMTPILGYAEMSLSHMHKEDPLYKYNEQILAGAVRARELVKQILTFSHKDNYKKEPLQISEIIIEALKLMRSIIPKTITINRYIKKTCGTVLADAAQIHQIVANLCTNSFQAMGQQGGTLSVHLKNTTVDEKMKEEHPKLIAGDYVELTIGDSGPGMDRETRNRIFEPFYTTKPVNQGTGLGLSVVHGIVKNHQGAIVVDSEPGRGTTFRIFLPVLTAGESPAGEKSPGGNKERILLLDDEEDFAELLKIILQNSGYEVESHVRAVSALKHFKSAPSFYSLILTDIYMPDMSGIDFIREVNRIRDDIPAIMITGLEENLTERDKRDLNIRKILYKPIMRNNLLEAVSENMKKSHD